MKAYAEMTREELTAELAQLKETYKSYQKMDLNLDMSRGKPSVEQLESPALSSLICPWDLWTYSHRTVTWPVRTERTAAITALLRAYRRRRSFWAT